MRRIINLLLVVALGIAIIVAVLLQPSDTVSPESVSLAELINNLSAARTAGNSYFEANRSTTGIKRSEQAALPFDKEGNRYFFVVQEGTLVGIDFKRRVVVVLTPSSRNGTLQWRCEGYPRSVSPKSCQ